jgi:hypothetical protein
MVEILTQAKSPTCPKCHSTYVVKKGKRRNRLQLVQLYECAECLRRFTGNPGRNKTYPLRYILEALSTYQLGYSLSETQRILRRRAHFDVPEGTLRSWLGTYRPFTTYSRLRVAGRRLFPPTGIIRSFPVQHKQVYHFQVHLAKQELLIESQTHRHLAPIRRYLASIDKHFPHDLFVNGAHRSSTFPATIHPPITRKENHATRLAELVLPTSPTNKKRHETLQRYMLINDSVTVAVEIPVYLTRDDLIYYRYRGFALPFDSGIVTGHVDFLQVRNGFLLTSVRLSWPSGR